jgi:hypothetical protein
MSLVSRIASAFVDDLIFKGRLVFGMLGAVCALGGGWFLGSSIAHGLRGVETTAVLAERIETCTAEFQPQGEGRRREVMPCLQAYAFRQWAGERKVKVSRKTGVLVRFPLANGTQHEAKVDEFTMQAHNVPVGAALPVVFDPRDPDDVRRRLTALEVRSYLIAIAVGLPLLLLSLFLGRLMRPALAPVPAKETPDAAGPLPEQPRVSPHWIAAHVAERGQEARVDTGRSRRPFGVRT